MINKWEYGDKKLKCQLTSRDASRENIFGPNVSTSQSEALMHWCLGNLISDYQDTTVN